MPSVEERVAYLEGRIGDHVGAITDMRTDIRALRGEVNEVRTEMHAEFASVRGEMSTLRGEVNGLRTEMHAGFASVRGEVNDLRNEMHAGFASVRGEMDSRFGAVDTKFTWVIGIQVGTLLIFAAAAVGFFFK